MSSWHRDLPPESNHGIVAWVYADTAARTASQGFTVEDIHKVAYQNDSGELYRLSNLTPTWVSLGGLDPTVITTASDHFADTTTHGISSFGASVVSAASAGPLRSLLGLTEIATASASTVAAAGIVPITTSSGLLDSSFDWPRGGHSSGASTGRYGIPDDSFVPLAIAATIRLRGNLHLLPFTCGRDIICTGVHTEITTWGDGIISYSIYECEKVADVTNASIVMGYTNFNLILSVGTSTGSVGAYTFTGVSLPMYAGRHYAVGVTSSGVTNSPAYRNGFYYSRGGRAVVNDVTSSKSNRVFSYYTAASTFVQNPTQWTENNTRTQVAPAWVFPFSITWVDQP